MDSTHVSALNCNAILKSNSKTYSWHLKGGKPLAEVLIKMLKPRFFPVFEACLGASKAPKEPTASVLVNRRTHPMVVALDAFVATDVVL